jgi:hypothetical protein
MSRINKSIVRNIASLNRQLKSIKLASVDNQDEMYSHCMFLVGDLAGKPNEQLEYIEAYIAELSGRDLSEALAAAQKYIDDCDMRADQAYQASKEEGYY